MRKGKSRRWSASTALTRGPFLRWAIYGPFILGIFSFLVPRGDAFASSPPEPAEFLEDFTDAWGPSVRYDHYTNDDGLNWATNSSNKLWNRSQWPGMTGGNLARAENAVTASSFKDPIDGTEYQGSLFLMTVPAEKREGGEIISLSNGYGLGLYEARIKATSVPYAVNAFFFRDYTKNPPLTGTTVNHLEIDFEMLAQEFGRDSGKVRIPLHGNGAHSKNYIIDVKFNPSKGFHNYCFIRKQDQIEIYIDGALVRTYTSANSDGVPMYNGGGRIWLNVWTGLPWTGGKPPAMDATMVVDWVRFVPGATTYTPLKPPDPEPEEPSDRPGNLRVE
jgi:beta-glucanase (GH16 family)